MTTTTPKDIREQLETLIEIWQDQHKPYQQRLYLGGALDAEMERAGALLARTDTTTTHKEKAHGQGN